MMSFDQVAQGLFGKNWLVDLSELDAKLNPKSEPKSESKKSKSRNRKKGKKSKIARAIAKKAKVADDSPPFKIDVSDDVVDKVIRIDASIWGFKPNEIKLTTKRCENNTTSVKIICQRGGFAGKVAKGCFPDGSRVIVDEIKSMKPIEREIVLPVVVDPIEDITCVEDDSCFCFTIPYGGEKYDEGSYIVEDILDKDDDDASVASYVSSDESDSSNSSIASEASDASSLPDGSKSVDPIEGSQLVGMLNAMSGTSDDADDGGSDHEGAVAPMTPH